MADYDNENAGKPRREVIIEDLRHRRDIEAGEELEHDEPAEEAAPEAAPRRELDAEPQHLDVRRQPVAEHAVEDEAIAATGAEGATEASEEQPAFEGDGLDAPYTEDEIRALEREQLKQIIGLGLTNYLKYQLTMVLNFALLNLGSAPDPTTGLVTKDLPQAKLAIDVLEFLVARLGSEISAAERAQMTQLVSDLKYNFMQAAAGPELPPTGGPTGEA
jgi:hypothetical protein